MQTQPQYSPTSGLSQAQSDFGYVRPRESGASQSGEDGAPDRADFYSGDPRQAEYLSFRLRLQSAKRRCAEPLDNGHISGRVVGIAGPGGISFKRGSVGPGAVPENCGPRGIVCGFSRAAKRRMTRRLARVDWAALPAYFVGLTYHDAWGASPCEWKADLKAWKKRLQRRLGGAFSGAIWKEELQDRGAPHFHLVLLLKVEVPQLELEHILSEAWTAIVSPGDQEHLRHGCNVQKIYNATGPGVSRLMMYLCKYISKEVNTDIPTGRMWGIWGDLPYVWVALSLSWADYATLCRRLRRWHKDIAFYARLSAVWRGFLLLGDDYAMLDMLRGLESVEFD